jgi:hypothetical protein
MITSIYLEGIANSESIDAGVLRPAGMEVVARTWSGFLSAREGSSRR